jgi:hypothetical protein
MGVDGILRDMTEGQQPGDAVVVPWSPGRVAPVAPQGDVDVVLDELFGPADDGGPGWFDAVLLVAGLVLVARGYVLAGVAVATLGLALPARSVARRVRRRAQRRRYAATGRPLATGSPETAALLSAYDALLDAAAPRGGLGEEAAAAGHRAVMECTAMLGGRAPETQEERAYVARRTAAVQAAAAALAATPPVDYEARVAAVRAREELDALAGPTSLDDLALVRRRAGEIG